MDEIIVITCGNWEDQLRVLERLKKFMLKLPREKWQFAAKEVKCLAYLVCTTGMGPQYHYMDRICFRPKPTTRDQLRVFLGLFPFLSMFSPCAASVLSLLKILFSKTRTMAEWSPEHDECFEAAESLFNGQELVHFGHDAPIKVHSDNSADGLGGVLMHGKPLWCASTSLTNICWV